MRPIAIKLVTATFVIAGLLNIATPFINTDISGYTWILPSFFAPIASIVIGLLQLVVAFAIWTKESYCADFAAIITVLGLLSFPAGTVLMVIAIVAMLTPDAKQYLS